MQYVNKMKRTKAMITSAALSLTLIVSTIQQAYAENGSSTSITNISDTNIAVTTITVSQVPQQLTLDAQIEAVHAGTVSAQTQGVIEKIHFDINDSVAAGQVLLEIRDSQQKAALLAAKAQLAQAEALHQDAKILLQRNQRLLKKGTLSRGEFDRSEAQEKSAYAAQQAAAAGVSQAQEQLSYTRVLAPYSGIVKARLVEVGESVSPGTPLMSGFSLNKLRLVTDIPAKAARNLNDDAYHSARASQNGQPIELTSQTLLPYAQGGFNSIRARFDIKPTTTYSIIPGSWAKITLNHSTRDAILVQESAVLTRSESQSVYVKTQDGFELRYIRTGQSFDQSVEIVTGLKAGDIVAVDALEVLAAQGKK